MVAPGLFWQLLGPGQNCEVNNCQQPAYKICDMRRKVFNAKFQGCGKKMCLAHANVRQNNIRDEYGHHKTRLYDGYHCTD